ncbi:neprilysin-11 [Parasteatoda tepidariorum]|uniref:neprilysin-11 n=1 Tax=Parasteatoda tepidariorum TaxID=114398 RepID=UPI001C717DF0|nr:neprilysin-11 [Parasteatoda tepidariorum]
MATCNGVRNINEINASSSYKNILGIPLRREIIIGVTVIFLLFITFVCTYLLLSDKPNKLKYVNIYSNSFSIKNINSSVDPCSNFYEFTCGLWLHNASSDLMQDKVNEFTLLQSIVNQKRMEIFKNSIPSSSFPQIVNDAFNFYNSCLNLNRNTSSDLNYILMTFEKMGGWPMLQLEVWDKNDFDWISGSSYLLKNMDIESIFGVRITVDDYNTSSNMIYITIPDVGKDDYSLKEFYNRQMLYVVLYTLNPDADGEYIIKDVGDLQKIETVWRDIIVAAKQDPTKNDPIRISLHDLKKEIPEIDFVSYINLYLRDMLGEFRFNVSEKDMILVQDLNYLKKAVSILLSDSFTKRDLANLFGWLCVQNSLILLPDVMRNYAEANQYDLQETMETIEDRCYEKTTEIYECSFDYLFVQNVSHDGIADSKILVQYLKNAFGNSFAVSNWLDDTTRNAATRKLNSLQTVLGFKSVYEQKSEFDNTYKDFPHVSENILETFYKIKKYFVSQAIDQLQVGNKISMDHYLPRPITDVSAYYILQRNVLVVPISLFSTPFYYSRAPWYLNFGALGAIIGHEMMHAFDKHGCRRDEHGRLYNWWTNKSIENYNSYSNCFKKQFISYFDEDSLPPAASTLDENMADTEGLHIAFKAYKQFVKENIPGGNFPNLEQYSPDQMFFISFGTLWCSNQSGKHKSTNDVHSSPEFRVNSAISNSEYFAQAFKCSENSKMHPSDKCHLW